LSWMFMLVAGILMQPVEQRINRSYLDDAKRILGELPRLKRIAVTGSYGKTSCKMALGRMLQTIENVLHYRILCEIQLIL